MNVQSDHLWFRQCLENKPLVQELKNITLVVCDVDGTLTNADIYVDQQGEGGREFSVQDGYIVQPTMKAGITIALMSGKDNPSTLQRGKKLGIPESLCIVGMETKTQAIQALQAKLNVGIEQTLIIGDDYLDTLPKTNKVVGLLVATANMPFYLQPVADLVLPRPGGQGAFRLLMDLILFVQEKHFAQELIKQALS
jgi:3-deoxy-D-manno-octulosonate 8-phosphate phosphatase (KDO 8-P phosphatase)